MELLNLHPATIATLREIKTNENAYITKDNIQLLLGVGAPDLECYQILYLHHALPQCIVSGIRPSVISNCCFLLNVS